MRAPEDAPLRPPACLRRGLLSPSPPAPLGAAPFSASTLRVLGPLPYCTRRPHLEPPLHPVSLASQPEVSAQRLRGPRRPRPAPAPQPSPGPPWGRPTPIPRPGPGWFPGSAPHPSPTVHPHSYPVGAPTPAPTITAKGIAPGPHQALNKILSPQKLPISFPSWTHRCALNEQACVPQDLCTRRPLREMLFSGYSQGSNLFWCPQ